MITEIQRSQGRTAFVRKQAGNGYVELEAYLTTDNMQGILCSIVDQM